MIYFLTFFKLYLGIFNYYPDKLNTCLSTRNRTKLVH